MEQRTLRLGDIVDDYCPRERRLTNHAIVAVVGDSIRQTRCTTCDSEHVYKGGQEPRRRLVKPGAPVAGKPADEGAPAAGAPPRTGDPAEDAPPVAAGAADSAPSTGADGSPDPDAEQPAAGGTDDLWIGNRPLIRATLPRVEGDPPPIPRPIPEFTMHQRQTRGAHAFRHGFGGQNPNWSGGNGHPRGGFRDGRGGGGGQGNGDGNSQGQGGQRPGRRGRRRGGKKNR